MNKHQSNNQDKTAYQPSKKDQRDPKPSVDQLKSKAYHIISDIVSGLTQSKLSSVDQRSINHKVNQLYKKVRSIKRGQFNDLCNIIVHLIRIKATERLANKKVSVDQKMTHAALSNRQSKNLSIRMKSLNQRIITQLSSQKDSLSIQETVADGISSFNGFYYKWLNISRTYLLEQLKKAVKKTKHQINKLALSLTAKRLAIQKICLIDNKIQNDVIKSTDFIGIHKVQKNGIKELYRVAADRSHVLHMMTSFDKFVDQIRIAIVKFKGLPRAVRLHLVHKINYYQDTVMNKFKHPFAAVADHILDAERPKLLKDLLSSAINSYYWKFANQVADFGYSNKYKPIVNFRRASRQIQQRLISGRLGSLDKDLFINVLKRINRTADNTESSLYQDRINRGLNNLSLKIVNHTNLSSMDQQYLYNQVVIYSKYIKRQPFTFRPSFIKRRLTAFFDRQYLYVIREQVLIKMTLLRGWIRNSRLSLKQRKIFLAQILKIWKSSQCVSVKETNLNQVKAQSLIDDRRQNLIRFMKLCHTAQERINTVKAHWLLRRKGLLIINRITVAKSISRADYIEQRGENWLYRDLLYKFSKAPHTRKQIIFDQDRTFHNEINLALLQPDLKQIVNDCIDQSINVYGDEMLQKQGVAQSKTRWSMQLSHKVQQHLTALFSKIQREYIVRTDNVIRDLYYQLTAYSSSRSVINNFEKIRSRVLKKIRQAKQFIRLESVQESGLHNIYVFADKIMGTIDSSRLKFSQSLSGLLKSSQQQLNDNPIKSNKIKSAFFNRMFKSVNQADFSANNSLNSDLNEILHNNHQQLNKILRQSYLYYWSKEVKHAKYLINNNLNSVSDQVKQSEFDSLKNADLHVNTKIRYGTTDLAQILRFGQHKLHHIIQHSIYLNPTKRSIYQKLNSAFRKTRVYVNGFTKAKSQTKYLKRLDSFKKDIDHNLSVVNDDHDLSLSFHTNYKKIVSLGLEVVRKAQLNKFNKYSSKVEDAIKKLKLLNNHESLLLSRKFNESYHKSIYQISHASKIKAYLSNEQKSEKVLSKVLNHGKTLNAKKDKYLHAIVIKINHAKQRINKLNNLNRSDKKASNHLLDEIKQRSVHTIGSASDKKHLLSIEMGGKKMVSQILDKIDSASVLVSAIRSADAKISKSSLNNSQKQNMLKKIRKMIGSEVDNDHKNHEESTFKKTDKLDKKDKDNESKKK